MADMNDGEKLIRKLLVAATLTSGLAACAPQPKAATPEIVGGTVTPVPSATAPETATVTASGTPQGLEISPTVAALTATPESIETATTVPKASLGAVEVLGAGDSTMLGMVDQASLQKIAEKMGPGVIVYLKAGVPSGTIEQVGSNYQGVITQVPQEIMVTGISYSLNLSNSTPSKVVGAEYVSAEGKKITLDNQWLASGLNSAVDIVYYFQDQKNPDQIKAGLLLKNGEVVKGNIDKVKEAVDVVSVDQMEPIDASKNPEKIAALPVKTAVEAWVKGKIRPGVDQGITNVNATKYKDGTVRFGVIDTEDNVIKGQLLATNDYMPAIILGLDKATGNGIENVALGITRKNLQGEDVQIVLRVPFDTFMDVGYVDNKIDASSRKNITDRAAFSAVLDTKVGSVALVGYLRKFVPGVFLNVIEVKKVNTSYIDNDPTMQKEPEDVRNWAKLMLILDANAGKDVSGYTVPVLIDKAQKQVQQYKTFDLLSGFFTGKTDKIPDGDIILPNSTVTKLNLKNISIAVPHEGS